MTTSEKIDHYVEKTGDWRGDIIAQLRKIVFELEPDIVEEWKWNSPVWSYHGMLCSPGAFKNHVGLNFFQGAHLEDSQNLFNGGLEAKNSRSINFAKGDTVNEPALKALIRAAIDHNKKS